MTYGTKEDGLNVQITFRIESVAKSWFQKYVEVEGQTIGEMLRQMIEWLRGDEEAGENNDM